MRLSSSIFVSACITMAGFLFQEQTASACGGCVSPPGAFTAVDSHRMVVKLGLEESILWDQFTYTGAPEEFAWVLPVPSPDTIIEIADSAFIDTIDEATAPRVLSPPCSDGGGCGTGCGDWAPPSLADNVTVHQRSVVGPYETVVLGADDPNALYAWLGQNGYAFPDTGRPVVDYYIGQGSSFVVLRLRPGQEVSAMQPVRVRFKGFMGQFPLKMVTLGASGVLELSLWIAAEQRYAASNYENIRINEDNLVWDWETGRSNYDEAFDKTILDAGGRAWITEYSSVLKGSELDEKLREAAPREHAFLSAGPQSPVITRLRTRMLAEYLTEDLMLGPAEHAAEVAREVMAYAASGECAQAVAGSSGNRQTGLLVLGSLFLFAAFGHRQRWLLLVFRRHRRAA